MTREELLKIIKEAKKEKKTVLNLSYLDISELPIEIGQLTNLRALCLDDNKLISIPESIGQLTNLQTLDLDYNQLTSIPESIGRLVNLRRLDLGKNRLRSIPDSICQLVNLQEFLLDGNKLTSIPELIGRLTNLQEFSLDRNKLTSIPVSIGRLASLQEFNLSKNQLTSIPESIGQLVSLKVLLLNENLLTSIPVSIIRLKGLRYPGLHNNPLNPALNSAYSAGEKEFYSYLSSIEEESEPLYEAKLVIVGEGGVGKTSLLKAMTGQEPQEDELTTHGVKIDVQALNIPHPEKKDVTIKFNAWDFGGQEVYRVTHQFFFSRRSVFILVWEPRLGVQQCQVEDWLKIIRLRVGDDAKVIIVSTHCEKSDRIARIDKPVFERDYEKMIVGFHEVDSFVDDDDTREKVGVAELKVMIADAAKDLEQMGMLFNINWLKARDELLELGETKPCITYDELTKVCEKHDLDDTAVRTLVILMRDLGYIVYYDDDERLKNDVILQPEWLTKAIGFVLEDKTTHEMDGILPDSSLRRVWYDHTFEGEPQYTSEYYPFFLRLMEKFDASYRLEKGDASLIAQHVPQVRPDLPWVPDDEPNDKLRRIAMVCKMDENPPGLVPWMIVRTHEYAYQRLHSDKTNHRLHWQKGMFLRKKNHGEAMLELRGREFHIYAEALWPEYFMNILRQTLHKLITDNWPGMEGRYDFTVPCREIANGAQCDGRFDIEALKEFLDEGDETIRCQECRKLQNIVQLLYGFEEENIEEQLTRIETSVADGFAGLNSQLAYYVMGIMHALANEAKSGPRLFTIDPVDGNWRRLTAKKYKLHLWCEAEGCPHPVLEKGKGVYEFNATREWLIQAAPYANFIAGVLKTILPMVAPAVNIAFGPDTVKESGLADHLNLMKEATGMLLKDIPVTDHERVRQGEMSEANRSGILALHSFLREHDPNHEKLGLKRVPTYTGDYLWLCDKHYEMAQSKIPDKIE
ncbi:MAG: hypothetical protein GY841_22020 [FCB group bacterium]|nr:hypothetical protein [FCB group bacterium]